MSSENTPDTAGTRATEEAHARIDTLEEYTVPGSPAISERLTVIRERVDELQRAESEQRTHELLDRIESELEAVRDAIEEDIDEGTQRAHEAVDRIEQKLSKLR